MKPDCDICCGAGFIRLPIRARLMTFNASAAVVPEPVATVREYACPECEVVQGERVQILESFARIDTRITTLAIHNSAREMLANQLGHDILKAGLVQFDESPPDQRFLSYQMRGRIGVASPRVVASIEERIEQRIEQRMPEVAHAVAETIQRDLDGWIDVNKNQMRTIVEHAPAKTVQRLRAAWKQVR